MKKYISLLIAVLLLFSFAACGGKEETPTTTLPLIETSTAPVIDVVQTTVPENPTYILTTEYGQTMPTVVTTRFDLANEITTAPTTAPSTTAPDLSFTVPSMSAPEVLSEQISSTVPGTLNQGQNGENSGSDTPAGETTKPADERERKNLEFNSSSFNSTGNLELCFDSAGWNSIKSGKVSGITVTYDGKTQTVEGYVKQGSDGGVVTVYTKNLAIPSNTVVTCSIPAGVVVSSNNKQYNMSYTFSTSTGADAADYD